MPVTMSFTVNTSNAALLLAFHDLLTLPDDVAAQTIENYCALIDVLATIETVTEMIDCAQKYDGSGNVIRDFLVQRAAHVLSLFNDKE